jgi:hypothetical protein
LKRGHEAWIRSGSGELDIWCRIGAMPLELAFGHAGRKRERYGADQEPRGDQPATTPLRLSVITTFRTPVTTYWDDGEERLESQIGAIAAGLMVAGEVAFREHLVEQREWDEQRVRWQEERRLAELEKLREQRLADLRESGELLRRAGEIRALVAQVRAAVAGGDGLAVTGEQLARWERWALGQADRLDPVRSGQVLAHLVVPALDGAGED